MNTDYRDGENLRNLFLSLESLIKMKIKDIISELEQFAPLNYQESYDNSGLIVGNANSEVKNILLCIDSTEAVVEEAKKRKCNLIIAHHPIIFSGLKKLNGKNYIERTILKAIKNDIAIYAAHTNLDNVQNGVSRKICEKLDLVNCKILSPKRELLKKLFTFCPKAQAEKVRSALFVAGAGVIGNYDETSFNTEGQGTFKAGKGANPFVGNLGTRHTENEIKIETIFPAHLENKIVEALLKAHPYEEVAYDIISLDNFHNRVGAGMIGELKTAMSEKDFLKFIQSKMKTKLIRYTELLNRKVKRVAVCGGSGSFLLEEAIRQKADFFISADFKYHRFFDAENKIVIADIGHYESEQFTTEIFYEILTKKFTTFALHFSKINTNPIKYFN